MRVNLWRVVVMVEEATLVTVEVAMQWLWEISGCMGI